MMTCVPLNVASSGNWAINRLVPFLPKLLLSFEKSAPACCVGQHRAREENDSHRSPARNEPASDNPKFFKGKAVTYYRGGAYKFEETARRGAIATLIIHLADLASYR